jgi:hypothetical protein
MQAGYKRVSVVRGGFPALMSAGVQVAPKDVTHPVGSPSTKADLEQHQAA